MRSLSQASADVSLTAATGTLTCPDGGFFMVISCLVHDVAQGGDDARASGGDPRLGIRSWTVLGDDDVPVVPVDRFLAYLTDIGRSPNTVKAYAHDLKDYWSFIGSRSLDWREARLEDVGEFVAWLQLPPEGRGRGRGAAAGDGSGDGLDGEPQARGCQRVLCAPGPQWCRGRRPAGCVETPAGGAGGSRSCTT